MTYQETVARIYRESVGEYGTDGVNRQEAIESAMSKIEAEVLAGRLSMDVQAAIRSDLRQADERDGRSADSNLKRAARGEVPLTADDLEVVVTLGNGLRKQWADVTIDDLTAMNEIRYKNFKAARDSYSDFTDAVLAVRPVLFEYRTFGAAFEANGFPPPGAQRAAA